MKKAALVTLLCSLCFVLGVRGRNNPPQNPALTPGYWTVSASVSHTNCPVTAGLTTYCYAGDGLWVSLNGAALVQLGAGGVTSIAVNGGSPQTGAVAIKIPTGVTMNPITPTGTIQ